MTLNRLSLALLSVVAALFCGCHAYVIQCVNNHPEWLAGPIRFFGITLPRVGVATAELMTVSFLCLAAYVFFGFRSDN